MLSSEELQEFKTEALELLETAEASLLKLDEGAAFEPEYNAIFRTFHNLKGAAGMMEFIPLQTHMHTLENILTNLKVTGSIPKDYIDLFLRGIDATRSILDGKEIQFQYEVKTSVEGEAPQPAPVNAPAEVPANVASELKNQDTTNSSLGTQPSSAVGPLEQMQAEFISEGEECIERIFQELEKVKQGKNNSPRIDQIYRDIHSLKGSAYLLGYNHLGDLSHAMEDAMAPLRDEKREFLENEYDSICDGIGLIDKIFQSIKSKSNQFPTEEIQTLIEKIRTLKNTEENPLTPTSTTPTSSTTQATVTAIVHPTEEKLATSKPNPPPAPTEGNAEAEKSEANSTVRVPVGLLDKLMTLVGEMVLVRNQVIQYSSKSDDLAFLNLSQRLNVVTGEIQGEMMKTRMQPIGNILSKFQRVVRDISKELKKKIELEVEGAETELDKTLLEAIKDPLTHIVRNSCDHGIENPEVRVGKGKSETGILKIRAFHEGGQVIVEIRDDGKGLHKDVLIKKAIEKGVLSPDKAPTLTDREAMQLIFAPGFSTAAQVTNLSGRGVGMDVVRSNVEKIGGSVELDSIPDRGTSIRLKIPLTLAIVPAMIVRSGHEQYAIPQIKLVELVRVEKSNSENKIEYLQGKPVYRLRGDLLPLVDLKAVMNLTDHDTKKFTQEAEAINIVVLQSEKNLFGLIVDEIQDTADIVVKPLNRLLKSLAIYSGATVLGDGSVALILDVAGLAAKQFKAKRGEESSLKQEVGSHAQGKKSEESQEFLLFRINSPTKHAVFLGYVHRLEEFKASAIEFSGSQKVVRYRNAILPIISVDEALGYKPTEKAQTDVVPVIVTQKSGKFYGFEVSEILDVFTTESEVDASIADRAGIIGNLVTENEVITVVDPNKLSGSLQKKLPSSNNRIEQTQKIAPVRRLDEERNSKVSLGGTRILFAEDTAFFRKHVTGVLTRSGFEVTSVHNGEEALLELQSKPLGHYPIVLSDIEMPKMTGLELAKNIRKDQKWNEILLIALTTKGTEQDRHKGIQAGFNLYLEKLDPEELISSLQAFPLAVGE
jgi:two-component system chemotaxis sensor kinase CheA